MKSYKKLYLGFLLGGVAFAGSALAASFDRDLYFGLRSDADVVRLQEFLIGEGVYQGPTNGNFFSLTKAAVIKFQIANNIAPVLGYVGPKTRMVINTKMTGVPTTPTLSSTDQIKAIQDQIQALLSQIAALQQPSPSLPTTPSAPTVATTTSVVVSPALPNPFDSTLKIVSSYPSYTLSSYGYKTLNELQFSSQEPVAITRIRLKNNGTFANNNLSGFDLFDSRTGVVLAKVDSALDGIIEFVMKPDSSKPNLGLPISGASYDIAATLTTPSYGGTKPYIRLDLEATSSIDAFDYNDLMRVANISSANFPVVGPTITAF